jgi:hydroxyethylthiazole kinase-like sugar kinase family protein
MMDAIGQFLVIIGGAFLGAWVGAKFALRQYQSQQVWDRKLRAYEALIEAIHHLKSLADSARWTLERTGAIDLAEFGSQFESVKNGSAVLAKIADTGSFIMSPIAIQAVERFRTGLRAVVTSRVPAAAGPEHLTAYFNQLASECEKALTEIKLLGKLDLNIW